MSCALCLLASVKDDSLARTRKLALIEGAMLMLEHTDRFGVEYVVEQLCKKHLKKVLAVRKQRKATAAAETSEEEE